MDFFGGFLFKIAKARHKTLKRDQTPEALQMIDLQEKIIKNRLKYHNMAIIRSLWFARAIYTAFFAIFGYFLNIWLVKNAKLIISARSRLLKTYLL